VLPPTLSVMAHKVDQLEGEKPKDIRIIWRVEGFERVSVE